MQWISMMIAVKWTNEQVNELYLQAQLMNDWLNQWMKIQWTDRLAFK